MANLWNQENFVNERAIRKWKRSISEKVFKWDLNGYKKYNLEYFFYVTEEVELVHSNHSVQWSLFLFQRLNSLYFKDYTSLIILKKQENTMQAAYKNLHTKV